MDAELSRLRVLLQLPHGGDGTQVRRPHATGAGVRLVVQSSDAFGNPATQRGVDRLATRLEVGGDALHVPALGVQADDGQPALGRIGDRVVQRVAALATGRQHPCGQHALHGMRAGPPTEAGIANGCQFVGMKGRVLGFEIDDDLAERWRQCAPVLTLITRDIGEQAHHPLAIEALGPPVDRPFRRLGLLRPLGRGTPEKHHRADQFVDE